MTTPDLTFACVLLVTRGRAPPPACDRLPLVVPIADAIIRHSSDGLPAELIAATISYESSYRQFARSRKGAIGLMQILPHGAIQGENLLLTFEDLCDIDTNLRIGTDYLKEISRGCKQPLHYLTKYNQGHGCFETHYSSGVLRELRRGRRLISALYDEPTEAFL